ncbi:hypothetical protein ABW19_dt0202080 [Dactylella cylindrospora]|nr:hypothetical protein ABW19_dt0202080 [Dactylella cylindrospora]
MAKPISQRPKDLFYRSLFSLMFVISLVVDCSPLYPEWLRPSFVDDMHEMQFERFKDPFFNPSIHRPWFDSFLILELFVLVPFNGWLLYAWTVDHPLVPLNMILYAYHLAITTIPCLAEIFSDKSLSPAELGALFGMYGPFVILPVYMVYDAYGRISEKLLAARKAEVSNKAE